MDVSINQYYFISPPLLIQYNTSRLPVEGKSPVCAISMKYGIMITLIINITMGQILLSYIADTRAHTHTRTHARTRAYAHTQPPTHRRRRSGCRCSMGTAPNNDEVNAPLSLVPLAMNGRSLFYSNKHSRMRLGIRIVLGVFRV